MDRSISEVCIDWYRGLRFEDLPSDVVTATKLRVLDTIGLALAGSTLDFAASVLHGARAIGAPGESLVLGFGDRLSSSSASLVNGTMAQALQYDDTHNQTIIHVSSPNVATALAVGEETRVSGRDFLAALAGSSELTCRLGLGAPGQFHKNGFHPSGIFGTFGATFAASRLMGLDAEQMRNAVGIAGSLASGILASWEDGTRTQFLHPGWSSHSGVAAAHLAAAGLTGPRPVFESRFGLFAAHVQEPGYQVDFERITAGLGEEWESRTISFKPYPTAHVIHSFLDAVLYLYEHEGLRAAAVDHIVCPIAPYMIPVVCEPLDEKIAPANDMYARISLQFSVAEALCRGRLGGDAYGKAALSDPEILDLSRRVIFEPDVAAAPLGQYKGWVIVHTKDGRRLDRVEPFNRGSAERPLSAAEIQAKFRENAGVRLSSDRVERVIAACESLDAMRDLRDLTALCDTRGG